jgi:uncharacterized membrane protein
MLAATFDIISYLGKNQTWARDFYRAGTFTIIGGAVVSVFAALTGFWDWRKSTEKGTQARRTATAHGWTMVTVTVLVLVDIGLRWFSYDYAAHTPGRVAVLTLVLAVLTIVGGTLGGSLAYDYGFNVETAGDSPVWHPSEADVFPADKT